MPEGALGLLAAAVPVGTLLGTAAIATGTRDHHRLLRNAAWCGAVTSAARRAAVLARGERRPRVRRVRHRRRDVRGVDPHQHRDRHAAQPRHPRLGHGHRGGRAHGQPGARRGGRWPRGQPGRVGRRPSPAPWSRPRRSASGRPCPRPTRRSTSGGRPAVRAGSGAWPGAAHAGDGRRPRRPGGRAPTGGHRVNRRRAAVRIHRHAHARAVPSAPRRPVRRRPRPRRRGLW